MKIPIHPQTGRIMKLTVLLLTASLLQVSAKGVAQSVTYAAKNVPLETVFSEIKKQTGYVFFYSSQDLVGIKSVSIDLKNAPLTKALDSLLKDLPLIYTIKVNTVFIRLKSPSKGGLGSGDELSSVAIDVHGHVTDSAGNPLAGASVTVKGHSGASAVTDASGSFTLGGISGDAILLISHVGYETQEVKPKGKSEISIQMRRRSVTLLDVVVNKGYYSTTNRLNTGDVSVLSGKEIEEQPVTDPILALIGRVPGLYIQQTSGAPGSYATIQIRGRSSISGGNDPLYIVDGVPFGSISLTSPDIGGGILGQPAGGINYNLNGAGMSPFNSLNPGDIESIEVLKDADATAIYGSRGSNGVILITTKKGKPGRTKVDVSVNTGAGQITRTIPLLNTRQYLAMMHEAIKNDGSTVQYYDYDLNGDWDTTRYTNWQKVLIGGASSFTNAQASLSGGNTNTQFLLSGNYNRQGVVFPGDYSDQKASAHFSLTNTSLDSRFHLQFSAEYSNDNSDLPKSDPTGNIILPPDAPALYDQYGNLNWQPVGGAASWFNPLRYTVQHATAGTDNLVSNLTLGYDLLPGLRLQSSFGYTYGRMEQSIETPDAFYAPPNNTNPNRRTNNFATTDTKTWNIEPQLSYHKKIRQGQLDALIGGTFEQNTFNYLGQEALGFASDALIQDPQAATTQELIGDTHTLYRYNALFGRIGYNWKEKYLINITARRDGSGRFGPGRQFGNFGAISAGWIFSKEDFIRNALPFLSFGKLRGSYGTTGNDKIGDYQFLSTYNPYGQSYQGMSGVIPTGLTNPDFAWEVDKKLEGGLDLGFLQDRIMFSASYYRNRSSNQLVNYTLPQITGFYSVEANFPATVQNTGMELQLNTTNIKSSAFSWTTSFNMTLPSNKLVAFPGIENTSYRYEYAVGYPLSIRYLYHYTGVNPLTGIYTFASKYGPGVPTYGQDFAISPAITQKFYGMFQNTFSYKGFELNVVFQFVKQLGYSYQNAFPMAGYLQINQPVYVLNRWQNPGNQSAVQQFSTGLTSIATSQTASQAFQNLQLSDGVLTDASFIRLKTLYLSYQLPGDWQQEMHMQNAKVFLSCQNVLTITRYKGLDPETQNLGLPPLRTFTAGLQLSL